MDTCYITLTNIQCDVCNTDKSHEIERKIMDQVSNYLKHSNFRGSRISIFVCNALNDARG